MDLSFDAISHKAINETCPIDVPVVPEDIKLANIIASNCAKWVVNISGYDDALQSDVVLGNYPGMISADSISGFGDLIARGGVRDIKFSTHNIDGAKCVISQPYLFSIRAFQGDEPSGGSREGAGVIEFINSGELDDLLCLAFEGRDLSITIFDECDEQSVEVYRGIIQSLNWNNDLVSLTLKDRAVLLDVPIQRNYYKGTGGFEGNASLNGKPKPLLFGIAYNITPILIDAAELIYQIHDGVMEEVVSLRDGGVELNYAGNSNDILNITVPLGSYVTDLSRGLLKIGAQPVYGITLDAKGDVPFIASTASIIERILQTRINNSINLDLPSFAYLNSKFQGMIGLYINSERTISSIFDEIMASAHGWWAFNRLGELSLGLLRDAVIADEEIELCDIISYKKTGNIAANSRRAVAYAKNYTIQRNSDMAFGADEEQINFATQEWRIISRESSLALVKYPNSQSKATNSLLAFEDDAIILADELSQYYSTPKSRYEVVVANGLFRYWIGDQVKIDIDRYKLDEQVFTIIGISENAKSGRVTLTLQG